MPAKTYETVLIPRTHIGVDAENNARRTIYGPQLEELAQSIRDVGLLQPVGVRPYEGRYLLVWGYRRLSALDKLRVEFIPAVVVPVDEAVAYEMMLAENTHREDVSPWDIGLAVSGLLEQGHDIAAIGKRLSLVLGRSIKLNRIHRLVVTCKGLIPEVFELWKRGLADFGENEAYRASQMSAPEQEDYFIELTGGNIRERRVPDGDRKKKRRKGRPTIRTVELAYVSLKQHEDDEHEDGLEDGERRAVKEMLQWIIGGRTKCPIRLRKRVKKQKTEKKSDEPVVKPTESVPIMPRKPQK